jgi:hypothetical protein
MGDKTGWQRIVKTRRQELTCQNTGWPSGEAEVGKTFYNGSNPAFLQMFSGWMHTNSHTGC